MCATVGLLPRSSPALVPYCKLWKSLGMKVCHKSYHYMSIVFSECTSWKFLYTCERVLNLKKISPHSQKSIHTWKSIHPLLLAKFPLWNKLCIAPSNPPPPRLGTRLHHGPLITILDLPSENCKTDHAEHISTWYAYHTITEWSLS